MRVRISQKCEIKFVRVCNAPASEPGADIIRSMEVIHIPEADAARDFAGLMARVRAGAEVVIENGSDAVAVIRTVASPRRSISESIARAEAYSKKLGYEPVTDAEFAAGMEEITRNCKPGVRSAWD